MKEETIRALEEVAAGKPIDDGPFFELMRGAIGEARSALSVLGDKLAAFVDGRVMHTQPPGDGN